MNLKFEIKRNADGVTTSQVWPDWDFNLFWWKEGNASCDCNREDFFLQAQGVQNSEHECKCSLGRYSVRCSDADTGIVLYDEFGEANDGHSA